MGSKNSEENKSLTASIDDPMNYLSREMAMLKFFRRVLFEVTNPENPLLERVRFLGILGAGLDEFFMVRVGGLAMGLDNDKERFYFEGMTPQKQLREIRKEASKIIADAQACFSEMIKPQLDQAGIRIHHYNELNKAQKSRVDGYYEEVIFPILTPLAFDPGHPFPYISNLSFNLAVVVEDQAGVRHFARLKVPGSLPHFLPCKKAAYDPSPRVKKYRKHDFVWTSEVIMANLADLFPGMTIIETHPFHVVRNAQVELQGLEVMDLLEVMEESVRRRRFGSVVRLMVSSDMPDYVLKILVENLNVESQFIYTYDNPVLLRSLSQISQIDRQELKYRQFNPVLPDAFKFDRDVSPEQFFSVIRDKDVMLHHPYQSFDPVIEFLRHAAIDPDVMAIKQTLYRIGHNSPVVRMLLQARRDYGKQVAVLVELKARFDEESNIEWAKLLEQEGVHVTYGLLGLKTHSKIALVVRKEGEHIRRYVHMGTGNYNHTTAKLYEDIGMFTSDDAIGADATDLFNYLTGYSTKEDYRKLLVAPVQLRDKIEELIHQEIAQHKKHGDGRIILKMNALVDGEMIRLLYKASQIGVKIDLIVRGICCLRPGVEGLSENIQVLSVIGRFLEHSRIYYFHNHGDEIVYLGSADLMPRNLNQRVEVLFPVENPEMIRHLRDDVLAVYLRDDVKGWRMQPDGSYERSVPPEGRDLVDVHRYFLGHR
ncbi:MAG: polyphosphate kinase 1 [Chloroflexota bacterium]|nr:polyphosphate kinase 1 [Chloroflexota bacterium]